MKKNYMRLLFIEKNAKNFKKYTDEKELMEYINSLIDENKR